MKAVWLEDGKVSVRDVPLPNPPPREALIRVRLAGICNTDLELQRGYYDYRGIVGHEFVGVVESGPDDWAGVRVVGEINAVCSNCVACRNGHPTHCENRTVLGIVDRDGAFAEFLSLPVANLHRVPEHLADDVAVFCEPLAAALQIQEQLNVRPSDRVAVIGDGKLGNLVAQTLALTGCDLTVVGRHAAKLALLERRGIRTAPAPAPQLGGLDLVVECTGNAAGFAAALAAVRPRGTIVMKSTYRGELAVDAATIVVNEINLVGSRCGPFPPALHLLDSGAVDVTDLVDSRYQLASAPEAFERARHPGVMKVLLDI